MDNAKKPAWKFFKSEMAGIVWDPKNNMVMAEFKDGVFETEDKNIAVILRNKGYIEIPMDTSAPPETVNVMPAPVRSGNIPLMPAAAAALKPAAAEAMADQINTQMDQVVDVPKATGQTVVIGVPTTPQRVK